MKFWKCEFCKHDTGPYKPITCTSDMPVRISCDNFELKSRMIIREMEEWHAHEELDEFIRRFCIELRGWQRTLLHESIARRPIYFKPARKSNFTTDLLPYIAMLELFDKEKESQN